jgi:hypothetical protein
MKPQSLQDAIKAQALRREKARQTGGWKEPLVKQHKVTAEDLVKSPSRRVLSPLAAPPIYVSTTSSAIDNSELLNLKKIVDDMKNEMKQQKNDIMVLQKENKELRTILQAISSEKENKVKTPASLEPHYAKDLAESQRTDKILRHFMKTKEGLYDSKHMSIRDENGCNIVCFKNKIYIPEVLRVKTIEHYKHSHPTDSAALASLRKNCCWLDLEKDFYVPSKIKG